MNPIWVRLAESGRIGLPAEVRRQAGLASGDYLWVRAEDEGVVTLRTAEAAVRRAQARARELLGDAVPTADEFLAEKREQVALEERKMRRLLGQEAEATDEVA
jgi:AbrB family looped-hinge helix DNA binding protein